MRHRIASSEITALAAEGSRVGLWICDECGAAVLIDPRDEQVVAATVPSRIVQHVNWHRWLEHRLGPAVSPLS